MTLTVNRRSDLTLEHFRRVSTLGEGVVVGPPAREAMAAARLAYGELERSGERGSGPELAGHRGEGQMVSLGDSFGQPDLSEQVVRGIVFARLADLLEGHGLCRPEVADMLVALLGTEMPRVPLGGAVSAGERVVLGRIVGAIGPSRLEPGEAAALLDGAPCSAALASDAALRAAQRSSLAEAVFSLSVEAMNAPVDAYHPALGEMWGDKYTKVAIGALNYWLAGALQPRRAYQAPVSYRILPVVLGQARRAAAEMERVARTALGAVTLDLVYLPPSRAHPLGLALESGGSYQPVYPAMSTLSAISADLCTLADRHTTKLHRSEVSLLPDRLDPEGEGRDVSSALLGFVQISLGERARHGAARTVLPASEGGSYDGCDDVALPSFLAYERERLVSSQLEASLAVLAVVASQALDVTGRKVAPRLRPLLDLVRAHVPVTRVGQSFRQRGDELSILTGRLSSMIGDGEVSTVLASEATGIPGGRAEP
ncbi:MAG: aromatic amino acid lyase [Acidimicrobiales bacterium]